MLRFNAKRAPGHRETFSAMDTKMVIRVDGKDLTFVTKKVQSVMLGTVLLVEIVYFDGTVQRVLPQGGFVGEFHMSQWVSGGIMNVTIEGLASVSMEDLG